ncbi:MAG: NAD-dependent epimerase/dehydratase family protein [Lachnospiraceae bacterium]|nr:NAD-dependent epimerase/dehydratase family protein [Lachnospiraceae bacterium]
MNLQTNKIYQSDIIQASQAAIPWEQLSGRTILITGATGMIASVMIDILMYRNQSILEQGQEVHIIAVSRNQEKAKKRFALYWDNPYFTYISHDITTPLPELGVVHYMLHAASNTHPRAYATDPIGTITANVQGTYQLLEYAVNHQCERFFFFSSVEIYGENRKDVDKFDEAYLGYIDCNTVRAGYPESKRLGESLCNAFAAQKGQDFVIGRFSRVYGPTMAAEDSKAIAQFIKKAVAGEDIVLKSAGNQLYSYTYVVDAATAAFYVLLLGESRSAVNIADGSSDIMLKDLAALLAEKAGTRVIFELPDAVEQAGYSTATKAVLDGSKLEQLGWRACTSIEEGIEKTIFIRGSIDN